MPQAKEIRDMDDDELVAHVANVRKDLFGLRFQHATGELESTAGLPAAKRELARALTIARQRELNVDRAVREN
jgi:large subunit ribosomal protein L29